MPEIKKIFFHTLFFLVTMVILAGSSAAETGEAGENASQQWWFNNFNSQWGGYVKTTGISSWYDDTTLPGMDKDSAYQDGSASFRLKNRSYFSDSLFFDVHYELILAGGDTINKENELRKKFSNPTLFSGFQKTTNDDRRLLQLTAILDEADNYTLYHRLDRLQLTLQPKWGVFSLGRQALTWGNGLLFNPMDLFNPFSPTDTLRDYKIGDDMVSVQVPYGSGGEFQFLLVPRRNISTSRVEADQSSFAGKIHFTLESNEFDLMLASHYGENVIGVGSTGYFKDAVWRMDVVWSSLNQEENGNGYLSAVANMDYSWVWWKKNFYGLIEFYYNGLGTNHYSMAFSDTKLLKRLDRGEIFVLGRTYLSGQINMELHPLFNIYLTMINNIDDPSGIIQPCAKWSVSRNTNLSLEANFYYGSHGTEFKGYKIESTNFQNKPPDSVFLWLMWYF